MLSRVHLAAGAVPRPAYLLVILAFLLQFLLHKEGWLPSATNYRIQTGTAVTSAVQIARSWQGLPYSTKDIYTRDDMGATYLMAALLSARYTREELAREQPFFVPPVFFFLMSLPFLAGLLLSLWALAGLLNPAGAIAYVLLLLFSGTAGFLAFSGDVYLFPFFSLSLLLAWMRSLRDYPSLCWLSGAAAGLLLFGIDVFRTSSYLLLGPVLLLGALPSLLGNPSRTRLSAALLLLALFLPAKLLPAPARHPFWQSIHAGLFEFGGWLDEEGARSFPGFVEREKVPARASYQGDWNDAFQFTEIRRIDPDFRKSSGQRPEYEAHFRSEVARLAGGYPRAILKIVARRFWRISVVNPWQSMESDSLILFSEPFDSCLRILVFLPVLAALFAVGRNSLFPWLVGPFAALCAPLLLVQSGYLMYNFTFHAWCLLLFVWSLDFWVRRLLHKKYEAK